MKELNTGQNLHALFLPMEACVHACKNLCAFVQSRAGVQGSAFRV